MTTVCFLLRGSRLAGFEISGHTGMAHHGADILCAAISSAAYMAANTITDVVGVKAAVEAEDGYMKLRLPDILDEELSGKCAVVLEGLRLHLKELRRDHPKYIKIINITTGKEHHHA